MEARMEKEILQIKIPGVNRPNCIASSNGEVIFFLSASKMVKIWFPYIESRSTSLLPGIFKLLNNPLLSIGTLVERLVPKQ